MAEYKRNIVTTLQKRMNEPRRRIQMLIGPRQTGKSTAIRQAMADIEIPTHVALASIDSSSRDWLRAQWIQARNLITPHRSVVRRRKGALGRRQLGRHRPSHRAHRVFLPFASNRIGRIAHWSIRDHSMHPLDVRRV